MIKYARLIDGSAKDLRVRAGRAWVAGNVETARRLEEEAARAEQRELLNSTRPIHSAIKISGEKLFCWRAVDKRIRESALVGIARRIYA